MTKQEKQFSIPSLMAIVLTAVAIAGAIFFAQSQGLLLVGSHPPAPIRPTDEEWRRLEALAHEEALIELSHLDPKEVEGMSEETKHRMYLYRLIRITAEWTLRQDKAQIQVPRSPSAATPPASRSS